MKYHISSHAWGRLREASLGVSAALTVAIAVNMLAWFASAPFISDYHEQQVARPAFYLCFAALGTLSAGHVFTLLKIRARQRERREEIDRNPPLWIGLDPAEIEAAEQALSRDLELEAKKHPKIPARCCLCQYCSGDSLLPCAVHPTNLRDDCPDFLPYPDEEMSEA